VNDAIQLRSDATVAPGYGGIDYTVPAGTTFADLQILSTDYNVTNDDCKAGSPRFQINVDTGAGGIKNIFAYIGPPPSFTGCPQNTWLHSGNLLGPANTVDTSQLPAGTFYDPTAAAYTKYGSYPVTGIQLVVDSGFAFADGEQTILIDNTMINNQTYDYTQPPTTADQCKNGGYKAFTNPSFKNQGQCVSSVEHQKHGK
jgi:hypothetical protein